jgi:hypothetical protein
VRREGPVTFKLRLRRREGSERAREERGGRGMGRGGNRGAKRGEGKEEGKGEAMEGG